VIPANFTATAEALVWAMRKHHVASLVAFFSGNHTFRRLSSGTMAPARLQILRREVAVSLSLLGISPPPPSRPMLFAAIGCPVLLRDIFDQWYVEIVIGAVDDKGERTFPVPPLAGGGSLTICAVSRSIKWRTHAIEPQTGNGFRVVRRTSEGALCFAAT
jgi:hypothetical protein